MRWGCLPGGAAIADVGLNPDAPAAAVLLGTVQRLARRLKGELGAEFSVEGGEPVSGSAADLLARLGTQVVALEARVALPSAGEPAPADDLEAQPEPPRVSSFALVAGPEGTRLAHLARPAEERNGDTPAGDEGDFDLEQHGEGAAHILRTVLQAAGESIAQAVGGSLVDLDRLPRVFSLDRDLNRATAFLGEGNLSGTTLLLSRSGDADSTDKGETPGSAAGPVTVWLLVREPLAQVLAAHRAPSTGKSDAAGPPRKVDVNSLLRISVPVIVTLAEKKMTVGELLQLASGQIIVFDKSCDEFLDLLVNNRLIGRGEAVKVGDKFGLRIVEIGDVKDTIRKLGES